METMRALTLGCLVSVSLVRMADGCCAVSPRDIPAVNADQTVILVWDRERKTEHFIRQASFRSESDSVGFLVPTPTRPQLEESGNAAFPYLAKITAPKATKEFFPIGCAVESDPIAGGSVRVIEEKTVAGFHTVVLAADSGKALVAWLQDHDYAYTPEAAAWAQPYLKNGWYMTAMKIAKGADGRSKPEVAASALRISFQTDRPLFPYREPDSRQAAGKLGISHRLLRIYFVAESRYEGRFSTGQNWSGEALWSRPLEASQRRQLLSHLALPESTGPTRFWLTKFDDQWPYGKAPGDVYFDPSSNQRTLAQSGGGVSIDPSIALFLGVVLTRPLWRRRKG